MGLSPEQQKELEELRAKRAALAEKRDKRAAERALVDELETTRRELADEEAIERLEEEHGPDGKAIGIVRTDLGAVVVKRPIAAAFKRFQDLMSRDNPKRHELTEQLVKPCLLHPDKPTLDQMVAQQPHIMIRAGNKIAELAGVREEEVSGK